MRSRFGACLLLAFVFGAAVAGCEQSTPAAGNPVDAGRSVDGVANVDAGPTVDAGLAVVDGGPCGGLDDGCCGTDACTGSLRCLGGICRQPLGNVGTGCVRNSDCAGGVCVPVGNGNGTSACSEPCSTVTDCVPGWSCTVAAPLDAGVCTCTLAPNVCNGKDNLCDGIVDDGPGPDQQCFQDYGVGYSCQLGICTCALECGTLCVDPATDPLNCGRCGQVCPAGAACEGGECACDGGPCGGVDAGPADAGGADAGDAGLGLTWIDATPTTGPQARCGHAMAYDSADGVTVLFGGYGLAGPLADTFTWNGATWADLTPDAGPEGRQGHALAYDSGRAVAVLFGGSSSLYENTVLDDTWEWNGGAWSRSTPAVAPPARVFQAMAYDSAGGVTVLFGGAGVYGGLLNDTWEWNGTTWTQQSPATSPPARMGHTMAYDSLRGVTVLFGGNQVGLGYWGDTWEWNGTTWAQSSPPASPPARTFGAMVYDSARSVTVLFGGADYTQAFDDTWTWDGSWWRQLRVVASPSGRAFHAMAYDSARSGTVLFGGQYGMNENSFPPFGDTWEFNDDG